MKTAWIGALLGALIASTVLNVLQYRAGLAESARVRDVVEALELTDAQVQQLTSCCDDCDCLDLELRDSLRDAEAQLSLAIAAERIDSARVEQLTAQVADLRRQMLESCVATIMQVRGVLSPEQRTVLEECCCDLSR